MKNEYDKHIERAYNHLKGIKTEKGMLAYLELLSLAELADMDSHTMIITGNKFTCIDKRMYGVISTVITDRITEMHNDIFGIKDIWRKVKRMVKNRTTDIYQ